MNFPKFLLTLFFSDTGLVDIHYASPLYPEFITSHVPFVIRNATFKKICVESFLPPKTIRGIFFFFNFHFIHLTLAFSFTPFATSHSQLRLLSSLFLLSFITPFTPSPSPLRFLPSPFHPSPFHPFSHSPLLLSPSPLHLFIVLLFPSFVTYPFKDL